MSPIKMSKIESGMRVALEFNKAFNRHDVPGMMQLLSEDCLFEDHCPAPDGKEYSGKEEITRFYQELFRNTPSSQIKIEDIYSAGDRCIMHWKLSWEEESGEKKHVRGVDLFRVKEGVITERLSYMKGII